MKKVSLIAFMMVMASLLLLLGGCAGRETARTESEETESVPVEVHRVSRGDISSATTLTGTVEAALQVDVVPKVGGKVSEVTVEVGDRVQKGQVLVRLDSREIRAQLKQALANLAAAQAGGRQSYVRHEDAKKNLERMEQLFEEGAISQQQLDAARLQYEVARPELAEAQVKQAKAAVEMARVQLENTVIEAPASGLVAFRYVDPGEMAAPGVPVVTIVDIDTVKVVCYLTERDINRVKVGQEVQVKVAAVSENPFTGKITVIGPAADPRRKSYPIEISIPNPDHILKPGMFAKVILPSETRKDVLWVPQEAILEEGNKETVFVVEEGQALVREIMVGISDGKKAEVVRGLQEGEEVVVKGQHRLHHGISVTVQGGDR
ncbi:efflux RND transporter periplasmic adaptor subunit [Calderihabitans maritimus]|uniref:Acrolide-specific efflux protein MacA n=1 Tax=Calderihabitans maritimus TaxID=1246530 RepID=A0A1Z5HSD4_9FIRM|nr:efflux RND transporter periplasmic adaptor subunit [Calderihabitans maritimus]GAW92433.1 acrolide-specific efflux protein MacA [Calderihabitans maritimus]